MNDVPEVWEPADEAALSASTDVSWPQNISDLRR